jgi:hypothetical protein
LCYPTYYKKVAHLFAADVAFHFAALMLLAAENIQMYPLAALRASPNTLAHARTSLAPFLKVVGMTLFVAEPPVARFAVL